MSKEFLLEEVLELRHVVSNMHALFQESLTYIEKLEEDISRLERENCALRVKADTINLESQSTSVSVDTCLLHAKNVEVLALNGKIDDILRISKKSLVCMEALREGDSFTFERKKKTYKSKTSSTLPPPPPQLDDDKEFREPVIDQHELMLQELKQKLLHKRQLLDEQQ